MVRQISIELLVVAAIGLALAALGPFGSYSLPLELRFALWIGGAVAAYALIRPMTAAGAWLSQATGIPPLAGYLVALSTAAVPITLLLIIVLRALPLGVDWGGTALVYLQVWGIGLAIHLLMKRLFPPPPAPEPAGADADAPSSWPPSPLPRLLARLPGGHGERILCLEMEDHYVRVHGANGSSLLLMRLQDAIAELDGLEGMQVHRSWWVARGAVTAIRRDNRSLRVVLENGMEVPVSRSCAPALRQAGWGAGAAA